MCKRERNFVIKVYLYSSSAIKKSAYILKKPIKKSRSSVSKRFFFPSEHVAAQSQ